MYLLSEHSKYFSSISTAAPDKLSKSILSSVESMAFETSNCSVPERAVSVKRVEAQPEQEMAATMQMSQTH